MDEGLPTTFPLSGLQVFPEQLSRLQSILVELRAAAGAELALITDRSGHCVGHVGGMSEADLAVLGSLLAGHVASSEEIAGLLDDAGDPEVLVREGRLYNLVGAAAGTQLLLLSVTPRQVPAGWARICTLKAAEQLRGIPLERAPLERAAVPEPPVSQPPASSLDRAIDQALDELWLNGHVHQLGEE